MTAAPLKVYLAAAWRWQDRMRLWRLGLTSRGVEVTARWLDMPGAAMTDEAAQQAASAVCLADVEAADVLVCLAETPDVGYLTGGRHVEVGYALALGRPVHLVGGAENVFHFHPRVRRWANAGLLIEHLAACRPAVGRAILDEGMTFEAVDIPSTDAEWLETQRVHVQDPRS